MKRAKKKGSEGKRVFGVELSSLIAAGLLIPPLRLYRRYKGRMLEATLQLDGQVEFEGTVYRTCSTAAEQARSTVTGRKMNTNGWIFWQFDAGGGTSKTLDAVREQFLSNSPPR